MYELINLIGKSSFPSTADEFVACVNSAILQNWQQIQDGYSNPYASTGMPMSQLHGAAYNAALMSNIGMPLSQGGAGMQGGFETILGYAVGQALVAGYNLCCYHNNLPILLPLYLP